MTIPEAALVLGVGLLIGRAVYVAIEAAIRHRTWAAVISAVLLALWPLPRRK
jgi:hypothetical protein